MGFTTLNLGLELTIPTNGTRNWGTTVFNTTWTKISQHQHTGSGDGQQMVTNSIANDAITGAKIRLDNDEWLRWRNAADSADVNVLKLDSSDQIQLGNSSELLIGSRILLGNGKQIYNTQAADIVVTGATATVDWDTGNWQRLDLQSNPAPAGPIALTLSNPQAGAWYGIEILQGANASVLDWSGNSVTWAQGEDPSSNSHLSTANGAKDHILLYYNGSEYKAYWELDFS